MAQNDLLHIQGKPYMLVPLHEYRLMTRPDHAANDGGTIPDDILDQLAGGDENPIKILRKYREMTQADLAEAADLSRPYLTEIERGVKRGSVDALKALAEALEVPVGLLMS